MTEATQDFVLSQHARERCQQRGISLQHVNVMHAHGVWRHTTKGFSCFMNRRARERVRITLGDDVYRTMADKLDFYLVMDMDCTTVLTVAHRLRRHKSA